MRRNVSDIQSYFNALKILDVIYRYSMKLYWCIKTFMYPCTVLLYLMYECYSITSCYVLVGNPTFSFLLNEKKLNR